MNCAFDLIFAPNQGIDLAVFGLLVQIHGELIERRCFLSALTAVGGSTLVACAIRIPLAGLGWLTFTDAVRNEVHHVEARHPLLVQVVNRMRVLLTKDRDQHIGASHFFFSAACTLHVHDGTLNDTLETKRGLRVDIICTRNLWGVVGYELGQRFAQLVDVS